MVAARSCLGLTSPDAVRAGELFTLAVHYGGYRLGPQGFRAPNRRSPAILNAGRAERRICDRARRDIRCSER
jgi:hypothetical protein